MEIDILGKDDFLCSTWAGGSSSQLYISPQKASYPEKNFDLRLSSALIELPESEFTPLPGYQRYIAMLEGQIAIFHNDQAAVKLSPYELHPFSGAWQTRSKSLALVPCRDFNLMLCEGLPCLVEHRQLDAGKTTSLQMPYNCEEAFIYQATASLSIVGSSQAGHVRLEEGQVAHIRRGANQNLSLTASPQNTASSCHFFIIQILSEQIPKPLA